MVNKHQELGRELYLECPGADFIKKLLEEIPGAQCTKVTTVAVAY